MEPPPDVVESAAASGVPVGPSAGAASPGAAWSDRPTAELERLLEEEPSHPDREAVAQALAARWKEHYLRVARQPSSEAASEGPAKAASLPAPLGWRAWWSEQISAARRLLAAALAPPPPPAPPQV